LLLSRNHAAGGGAAVDDDAVVVANALCCCTGDIQLAVRHHAHFRRDCHFAGQRYSTTVAAQQQAAGFQQGQILAYGDFGGGKAARQVIDTDFARSCTSVAMAWRRCWVFRLVIETFRFESFAMITAEYFSSNHIHLNLEIFF
jgi:hypothetical protein